MAAGGEAVSNQGNQAVGDSLSRLRAALSGRYAIEGELGHGGMATVYRAHDLKHDRPVAVKVIRPELSAGVASERFVREVHLAARLQHPNILPVYDSGEADGQLYYVMPLVEGESLRDRLDRERQLPLDDTLQIGRDVAAALAYAHHHGVVHRDVKPENILLTGGHAVVADFGIARAISAAGADRVTETGIAVGTPVYMSPEQGSGERVVDPRSDIYSLGCVLYELLAGVPPFTGPNAQVILARHSLDVVPPLRTARETVPASVEAAIMRALAKTPADRFSSAEQFARALSGETAAAVAAPSRRTKPFPRVALLLAPVLLAAAIWGTRSVWRAARPAVGAGGGLDPSHIAVRYFEDLSRARTLGPLADGLTEALIARLTDVKALDVVSKNGVAPYRGSIATRDSIARALAVGSLIEGSVEEAGARVRVTVRLVDGASGADVDRATFERPPGDALQMQDDLADRIATFLRRRLGEAVRLERQKGGTASVEAWLLVQRAERTRKDADSLGRAGNVAAGESLLAGADSLLAQAEAADPQWIEPIVLRAAVAYRHSRPPFFTEPLKAQPWITVGLGHAGRALARQPNEPRALEQRGTLHYWSWLLHLAPDPRDASALLHDAEQDLRAAVRLDPSLASAWSVLSHLDYQKSDIVQAKLDAQRGYEADAYYGTADAMWRLYTSSYDLGQFADAVHWCDEGGRRFPGTARFVQCQLWLFTTSARPADPTAAWRLAMEVEQLTPPQQLDYGRREAQIVVAAVLARAGNADSARHLLARSRGTTELDPSGTLVYYEAFVRTLLGDRDEALRLLKAYIADNPERRADLAEDYQWWFRDLRNDPRYRDLAGVAAR
jgi:eukaryotic-like serine/threonine-protein kinase